MPRKKKHKNTEMAIGANGQPITCCITGCRKGIKLNVYENNPHIPDDKFKCYGHWLELKRAKQNSNERARSMTLEYKKVKRSPMPVIKKHKPHHAKRRHV